MSMRFIAKVEDRNGNQHVAKLVRGASGIKEVQIGEELYCYTDSKKQALAYIADDANLSIVSLEKD